MPDAVLLARHYYPSPGAATNRLMNMVSALVDAGWGVTVITRTLTDVSAKEPARGPLGERILRVPGDSTTGFGWGRLAQLTVFPWRAARVALKTLPPADVVVCDPPPTMGLAAIALARRWRGRSVYYLADRWQDLMAISNSRVARLFAAIVAVLENWVIGHSDHVLAVTEESADYAATLNGCVTTLTNGVDGSAFRPDGELQSKIAFDNDLNYFLYAGNYGEAHGATIFAEAAHLLWKSGAQKFGVIYVGYGSDDEQIREIAWTWPDQFRLLDPVQPDIVAAAYRGAIAGLASVKSDNKMHGVVSVKALASIVSGCPILYVGSGRFRDEVISNDYGFACDREPEAVAKAMIRFLEDPWDQKQRCDLAERARSKYDVRRHHPTYRKLFESLAR